MIKINLQSFNSIERQQTNLKHPINLELTTNESSNYNCNLRGGGSCSIYSNTRNSQQQSIQVNYQQNNIKEKIQNLLTLIKRLDDRDKSTEEQYKLMKQCIETIRTIYDEQFENIQKEKQVQYQQCSEFQQCLKKLNEIKLNYNSSIWLDGLQIYLESIDISLRKLQLDSQNMERMGIINLMIQISKKKNEVKAIEYLIEAARYLLTDIQFKYYTTFQQFQTFYFFKTLHKLILYQIESGIEINAIGYIEQIQQEFIENSINWKLHFCWIEFLVELVVLKFEQKQNSNQQDEKIIQDFIVIEESIKKILQKYIKFKYPKLNLEVKKKGLKQDYSGLYRLNRILSVFTNLVQQIENLYNEFNMQHQVSEAVKNLYENFRKAQICLLEISQCLFEEEQLSKFEQMKSQDDRRIRIVNTIKELDEAQSKLKVLKFVIFYCQNLTKVDKVNNNQQFQFEKLEDQIQELNNIINIVSNFILLEQYFQLELKVQISFQNQPQGFKSFNYQSINSVSKSQSHNINIENSKNWMELLFNIEVQLTLSQNIYEIQTVYHSKLKQIKENQIQFELHELIDQLQQNHYLNNNQNYLQNLTQKMEELDRQQSKKKNKNKKIDELIIQIKTIIQNFQSKLSQTEQKAIDNDMQKICENNNMQTGSQTEVKYINQIYEESKNFKKNIQDIINNLNKKKQEVNEAIFKQKTFGQEFLKTFNISEISLSCDNFLIRGEKFIKDDYNNLKEFYSETHQFWTRLKEPLNKSIYQQFQQMEFQEQNDDQEARQYMILFLITLNQERDLKFISFLQQKIQIIFENEQHEDVRKQLKSQETILYQQKLINSNQENFIQQLSNTLENCKQGQYNQSELIENLKEMIATLRLGFYQISNSIQQEKRDYNLIKFKSEFLQRSKNKKQKIYVYLDSQQSVCNTDSFERIGQNRKLLIEFPKGEIQNANAEINHFLFNQDNPNSMLLIAGHSGSGKTTVMKRLQNLLWNQYKASLDGLNWIPIYVDLSKVKKPLKDLNLNKILECFFNIDEDKQRNEFQAAIENGEERIVLILDGLNEIDQKDNILEQLWNKIRGRDQCITYKIIMTARKDILTLNNFKSQFSQDKIQITEIQELENDQQKEYIKQYFKIQIQDLINRTCFKNKDQQSIDNLFNKIDDVFQFVLEEGSQQFQNDILKNNQILSNNVEFEINLQDLLRKLKYFLENIYIPILKDILITPQMLKVAIKQFQNRFFLYYHKLNSEQMQEKTGLDQNQIKERSNDVLQQFQKENFFKDYHLYDSPILEQMDSINPKGNTFIFKQDSYLRILALNSKTFSKYFVLMLYIKEYFKKQVQKNQNILKNFYSPLQILPILLDQSQRLSFYFKVNNIDVLNDINKLQQEQELANFMSNRVIRNCMMIRNDDNQISFYRKKIQDFFVAQFIFAQLEKNRIEIIEFFNCQGLNLSEVYYKEIIQLLIYELKNINNVKQQLLQITEKSKNNEDYKRASSNGIFLLSKLGFTLKEQNFEGLIIENTSIAELNLIGCNLRNSRMNNVEINFCKFESTDLNSAQWTNVICVEYPRIYSEEEILQVILFNDNKKLTVLNKKQISIVDIQTGQNKSYLLDCITQQYKQIIISKDEVKLYASTDHQIEVLNLVNQQSSQVKFFQSKIISFCLSPNSSLIACSLQNQTIFLKRFIRLQEQQEVLTITIKSNAQQLAINEKCNLLVLRDETNKIKCYSIERCCISEIDCSIDCNLFASSKDGRTLVIQQSDKILFYWFDIEKGALQSKNTEIKLNSPLLGLQVFNSACNILFQMEDKSKIFNVNTKSQRDLQKKLSGKNSLISEDGSTLISWRATQLNIWDLNLLENMEFKEEIDSDVKECKYSSDGQNLLIKLSQKALLWNIQTSVPLCVYEQILCFCFKPNSNLLATFSNQGLKLWNTNLVNQRQLLFQIHELKSISKMIFSVNGDFLALLNKNKILQIIKISKYLDNQKDSQDLINFYLKQDNSSKIIQLSPDEKQFIIIHQNIISIYDYQSKRLIHRIQDKSSNIYSSCYSQDQKYIIVRTQDQQIRIWSMQTYNLVAEISHNINEKFENHCLFLNIEQKQHIITNFQNQIIIYDISEYLKTVSSSSTKSESFHTVSFLIEQGKIPDKFVCRNITIAKNEKFLAVSFTDNFIDDCQTNSIILIIYIEEKQSYEFKNKGGSKIAISPNNQYLATNSFEKNQWQIIVMDISNTKLNKKFSIITDQSLMIKSMDFSPINNLLLISDNSDYFSLYDFSNQINQDKDEIQEQPKLIDYFFAEGTNCTFSNDGKYLFYIQNNMLKLVNLEKRLESLIFLNFEIDEKDELNFYTDLIYYSIKQNKLIKFDMTTRSQADLHTFNFVNICLTFSYEGNDIAFVNKGQAERKLEISIQDISNISKSNVESKLEIQNSEINLIQFSKDSKYLIAFSFAQSNLLIYLSEERIIKYIQCVTLKEKILSFNFHPEIHEFLIFTNNREILLYQIGQDQKSEFQKYKIITGQYQLNCQGTKISNSILTSKIEKQNLNQLFIQKGALN